MRAVLQTESTPLKPAAAGVAARTCSDPVFAVLFVVHLLGVGAIAAVDLPRLGSVKLPPPTRSSTTSTDVAADDAWALAAAGLVPGLLVGALATALSLWLMLRDAGAMFRAAFVASLVLLGVNAIALFASGAIGDVFGGIALVFVLLIHVWFYCVVQRHLPFALASLETAAAFVRRHPSSMALGFASLVPLLLHAALVAPLLYVSAVDLSAAVEAYGDGGGGGAAAARQRAGALQAKLAFLAFSLFWVWQLVASLVHVSVAGAFAAWYFQGSRAVTPVRASVGRACTSSFGSVAFGSLLTAIIRFLRFAFSADRRDAWDNCCVLLILECLEALLRFFNKYAFCYVAIYGYPFCTAGREVVRLFEEKGLQTLINDDLVLIALLFPLFAAFGLGALCGGVAGWAVMSLEAGLVCAFISGLIAAFVADLTVVRTIDSCAATLFVCFAENPQALSISAPDSFSLLSSAWSARFDRLPVASVGVPF